MEPSTNPAPHRRCPTEILPKPPTTALWQRRSLESSARILAYAIYNTALILNCRLFVLGGGAGTHPAFVTAVQRHIGRTQPLRSHHRHRQHPWTSSSTGRSSSSSPRNGSARRLIRKLFLVEQFADIDSGQDAVKQFCWKPPVLREIDLPEIMAVCAQAHNLLLLSRA